MMADQVNYDANNNNNNNPSDKDNDDNHRNKPSETTKTSSNRSAAHKDGAIKRAENNDHGRQVAEAAQHSNGQVEQKVVVIVSKSEGEKCHTTAQVVDRSAECAFNSQLVNNLDADAWHLLDVDGQSVAASSTSSSSNEHDELLALESDREKRRQRRRLLRRRGVEMDQNLKPNLQEATTATRRRLVWSKEANEMVPNGESGQQCEQQLNQRIELDDRQLSRALIFTCTALYALMPLASLIAFITFICLLFTSYWPITVIYYTLLILDSKTCNKGGRRIEAVYKSKFWTYLAAHFPIRLKYSQEFRLDPSENYILNYHPHGISAFGCVSAFATNALNFKQLFPGITSRFMVHETSFLVPVMRETFSFRGDCSVNSKSFDYILSKKWQPQDDKKRQAGNLLALCGGGLAEADLSDEKCLKIVVATRKGFVKKAIIHGAHLIPCIAFGENSAFTKFRHPIYYGASAFSGDKASGIMPYKRPITVVMGDPIQVKRIEEPSQAEIDQLHGKYIESLKKIYADNKHLCGKYDLKLELV